MPRYELIRPTPPRTWLQRMTDAVRSITLGPYNPKDKAIAQLFGGRPVSSGVSVNESTAMNYSAVWAATNLIASDIGKVPLPLYKILPNGGKEKFKAHPLYRIVCERPNPQMGSMKFRQTLQAHALNWGNGFAEIERDAAGRPVALWPLLPIQVAPLIDGGRLRYKVKNPVGNDLIFDMMDILHIRGLSEDGICGYSVIGQARESIGLGIASERFGGAFYGNSTMMSGVVTYPPGITLSDEAKKDNRKALERRHQGVDNAHRLLALYEGATYQQLGVPPNAAQFLETRQFQIEEIARWYNCPPHKLRHLLRTSYNSIEHQGIEYVVDTLDSWWVTWEEELNMKLVAPLERSQQVIEHVREGMLRGDSAARGEFYAKLFAVGAITPNEIRARENLNPIEGGDTPIVQLNGWPLARLDEWCDAALESKKAPTSQTSTQPPDPDDERKVKDLEAALAEARKSAQAWEDRHDLLASAIQTDQQERIAAQERERDANIRAEGATAEAHRLMLIEQELRQQIAADDAAMDTATREIGKLIAERDAFAAELADAREEARVALAHQDIYRSELKTEEARAALECQAFLEAFAEVERAGILAQRDIAQAITERDEHAKRYTAEISALKDINTQAARAYQELQAERDALTGIVSDLEAGLAHAQDSERTAIAERDERAADLIQLRDALASLQARFDQNHEAFEHNRELYEDLSASAAVVRAELAASREHMKTQRAVMLSAMRSLFVDATERLLQREAERIRKHQQTPDKLRDWSERFYTATHTEVCRNLFRPLVGPWTAVAGGSPSELLERLVAQHIEQSRTALNLVLDETDPDAMAGALERTLRRWEDERADAMADALVREGMAS